MITGVQRGQEEIEEGSSSTNLSSSAGVSESHPYGFISLA